VSCASSSGQDNDAAVAVLGSFYKEYILETSKMPLDMPAIEALKAKHCSASLLAKLKTEELDADPFLNVQDVDAQWAESLEVKPADGGEKKYSVCWQLGNDGQHCVVVQMKQEDGGWKLNQVQ
jgi:hypothetical protein